jgi:cytochrome c
MKNSKILVASAAALLVVALSSVAVAQGKATARDVIAKVTEAARTLSKTRDLTPFTRKQGPWVWKDTYVFVVDCDKKIVAAHPIKPELVGHPPRR